MLRASAADAHAAVDVAFKRLYSPRSWQLKGEGSAADAFVVQSLAMSLRASMCSEQPPGRDSLICAELLLLLLRHASLPTSAEVTVEVPELVALDDTVDVALDVTEEVRDTVGEVDAVEGAVEVAELVPVPVSVLLADELAEVVAVPEAVLVIELVAVDERDELAVEVAVVLGVV